MMIAALVLAGLAALVHVYIFVLETLRWEAPRTREIFGLTEDEAAMTRSLAANQGVYNLMLAIVTVVGIVLQALHEPSGGALILAGTGSVLGAALFLGLSDRSRLRPAATQGALPLLAILAFIAALAMNAQR